MLEMGMYLTFNVGSVNIVVIYLGWLAAVRSDAFVFFCEDLGHKS